ncbi:hypothetical protein HMPREF9445_00732 [Bacteroides clarus YIT 12056]|uniref:Uncharacterized protein n=1 Tax=Bacteroides clarus YIT 12056 TaxID=762984 RepID=A0ABN0CR93_9BACE|nr:hypothetical protein HMPREF9445_00732 [Bacteroides clarus YIT 12056]
MNSAFFLDNKRIKRTFALIYRFCLSNCFDIEFILVCLPLLLMKSTAFE